MTTRRNRYLDFVKANPGLTSREIARRLNVSGSAITSALFGYRKRDARLELRPPGSTRKNPGRWYWMEEEL